MTRRDYPPRAIGSAAAPPVPPENPLPMPTQDLRAHDRRVRPWPSPRTVAARIVTFGVAAAMTGAGGWQMTRVIEAGGTTVLEIVLCVLFVLTFSWIALAASAAIAGVLFGRRTQPTAISGAGLASRNVLVMPVYNEDPVETCAALQAMAEGLIGESAAASFEIFILSDTNDPEAWIDETIAFAKLRRNLRDRMAVWYRRRDRNTGKKAGNLRDFIERWGGRYDHMIVLDADSVMAPATLVTLAAAMEEEADLGILQTVPVLAGRDGLLPRLQQFAGRAYGPVVARGVAAWQGDDGNYWGHNAIIRVGAFAAACGLPDLPGHKPFGGPVMSHDFVEAALMRRAGWAVRMAPDLGGSWEGGPPTLLNAAQRDRRWAQGNIQHLALLGTRGLAWPSRMHFLTGVFSYLSSPLWLAMLMIGILLTVQTHFAIPRYFTETFQLFPTWPRFDSERMLVLFASTMAVLFLPKLIGLIAALRDGPLRRGVGGALPLLGSVVSEVVLSALYAPVMMLMQTRQVLEILLRRDSGWSTQNRDGGCTAFAEIWRRHASHLVVGLAVGAGVWSVSPGIFWWLFPTLAGLVLAIPLSWSSGSASIGQALARLRLLVIPEESDPPPVMLRQRALVAEGAGRRRGDSLHLLASDAEAHALHFSAVLPPRKVRGQPDPDRLTAAAKIADAETLDEALSWLTRTERTAVAADPELAARMARLAAGSGYGDLARRAKDRALLPATRMR